MKINKMIAALIMATLTMASPFAWSKPDSTARSPGKSPLPAQSQAGGNPSSPHVVPEIDAASGSSAVALLVGMLLLAGERIRSRRS